MRYEIPNGSSSRRAADPPAPPPAPTAAEAECCEVCNSPTLYWRNCKLVCANCRTINRSCADL